MTAVAISNAKKSIIKKIFQNCPYQIIIFGSRAKGTNTRFSDLDICLKESEKIPFTTIANYQEACTNSDLPYKVDIIDFHNVSESFQKIIERNGIIWHL